MGEDSDGQGPQQFRLFPVSAGMSSHSYHDLTPLEVSLGSASESPPANQPEWPVGSEPVDLLVPAPVLVPAPARGLSDRLQHGG